MLFSNIKITFLSNMLYILFCFCQKTFLKRLKVLLTFEGLEYLQVSFTNHFSVHIFHIWEIFTLSKLLFIPDITTTIEYAKNCKKKLSTMSYLLFTPDISDTIGCYKLSKCSLLVRISYAFIIFHVSQMKTTKIFVSIYFVAL